jgi:hypothetical protein
MGKEISNPGRRHCQHHCSKKSSRNHTPKRNTTTGSIGEPRGCASREKTTKNEQKYTDNARNSYKGHERL